MPWDKDYALPSILSNTQEGQGGEGVIVAGSSNLEVPTMVPNSIAAVVDRLVDSGPFRESGFVERSFQQLHLLMVTGKLQLAVWKAA